MIKKTVGVILVAVLLFGTIFNQQLASLVCAIGANYSYQGHDDLGNFIIKKFRPFVADDSGELARHLSVQNTKNGNYHLAMPLLDEAYSKNPKEIGRYYGWLLLFYYREYNQALQVLEKYDAQTPNFADAPMGMDINYLKGLCHMNMDNATGALSEFDFYINRLTEKNQAGFIDVYAWVQKGRCHTGLGEFNLAHKCFKTALDQYENCSEAFYFQGLTYLEENKIENSITSLERALELISKGHKSSDTYVELFHEIYPSQIREKLNAVRSIIIKSTNTKAIPDKVPN
jgi:tetratricopeptide (TPR) repeat protein